MAQTVSDVVVEKIEVVDQPDEMTESKGLNFWLLIPVVLLVATGTFFFVRSWLTSSEE